jgi:DNA-binding transcriptional LysR family regulator
VKPDLDQGALVELMRDQRPLRDMFRLVWRSGDPREPELQALADDLRKIPLR